MTTPTNPQTVVIQNQFYPGGLSELQIWKHYQLYKDKIIEEIGANPVLIWIFVDLNQAIIKRKLANSPFTINRKNYDKIMTGRTVSVAVEQKNPTDVLIVDIDRGNSVTEIQLKTAVKELLNSSIRKQQMVSDTRVISTGKGYHVYFYLGKKMDINAAKKILYNLLKIEFGNKYLINDKNPSSSEINLDLTPTTFRGVHQVPYALCRNGLMSIDVGRNIDGFNRNKAIIK